MSWLPKDGTRELSYNGTRALVTVHIKSDRYVIFDFLVGPSASGRRGFFLCRDDWIAHASYKGLRNHFVESYGPNEEENIMVRAMDDAVRAFEKILRVHGRNSSDYAKWYQEEHPRAPDYKTTITNFACTLIVVAETVPAFRDTILPAPFQLVEFEVEPPPPGESEAQKKAGPKEKEGSDEDEDSDKGEDGEWHVDSDGY